MSAGAVIVIRRKRLVRRFRELGATDLTHAVTLQAVGERPSWIFYHMVQHGVFVPVHDGRYFMNQQAATEFLLVRRRRALILGSILLFVFVILLLFGFLHR